MYSKLSIYVIKDVSYWYVGLNRRRIMDADTHVNTMFLGPFPTREKAREVKRALDKGVTLANKYNDFNDV